MTSESRNGRATPKASRRDSAAERVDINVGHACNHTCIFCMQGGSSIDQKKWATLDTFKNELSYYANEKGLRSLGILGGEPTLYPWLAEALDHARALGYDDITINTNGFRLADWDFAKMAAEKGINRYCISFHSESPEVEDYLSGKKGSFLRKMRAIRNISKLRAEGVGTLVISINAVLNSRNLPTIERFVPFFKQMRITDLRLNYIRPEGRAENNPDLVPKYADAIPKLMNLVKKNETVHRVRLSFGEIPPCVFPRWFFENEALSRKYIGEYTDRRTYVTTFGNTRGHLSDNDGKQRFVWQDLRIDELKTFVNACQDCEWKVACGGVWKNYVEMYGDEEFSALSE